MRSRERAAATATLAVAITGWLALVVTSCAPASRHGGPQSGIEATGGDVEAGLRAALAATDEPLSPGALRVRLAMPEDADLDLFVTDPAYETVYFANSPSRSGGRLERDVRCGDAAPRVETIVFPHAAPGRYRVGVDFPKPCRDEAAAESPYLVAVDGVGPGSREDPPVTRGGRIASGVFLPIVLELDRPATPED